MRTTWSTWSPGHLQISTRPGEMCIWLSASPLIGTRLVGSLNLFVIGTWSCGFDNDFDRAESDREAKAAKHVFSLKQIFVCRVSRSQPGSHHSSFSGKVNIRSCCDYVRSRYYGDNELSVTFTPRDHEKRGELYPTSAAGAVQYSHENVKQRTVQKSSGKIFW